VNVGVLLFLHMVDFVVDLFSAPTKLQS